MSAIPAVEPDDTVWWHGDCVHSVADVSDQQRWGNVMYIPVSPYCAKNAENAADCGRRFLDGRSPADFAPEDYEVGWSGRANLDDLTDVGRGQLGLHS